MSVPLTFSSKLLKTFLLFLMVFLFLLLAKPAFAFTPNDGLYPEQWYLHRIGADRAWDITQGSASVIIGLIDSGVYNHQDLASKKVLEANFTNEATAEDTNGHGTQVAGIAAAATNNGTGIASLGFNTRLISAKVFRADGTIRSWQDVYNATVFVVDNGAKVINMSIASTVPDATLESAIAYARDRGVIVVAPVANNNSNALTYPAYYSEGLNYPNVISVAGTGKDDKKYSVSNYGSWVDVAAPAEDLWTTFSGIANPSCVSAPGDLYCRATLNSYAAPQVAALAALLLALHPTWTDTQVIPQIQNTADPVEGTGTNWAYGRINACKAVGGTNCDVTNGLIGNWRMNEAAWNGTAGEVKDASGNDHGTARNGANIVGGAGGNNVGGFDGVDDYVDLGTTQFLNTNVPFTISAWIRPEGVCDLGPTIFASKTNTVTWGLLLSNSCTTIQFGAGTGWIDGIIQNGMTFLNSWRHVALTYNGNGSNTLANFSLYVDTVLQPLTTTNMINSSDNSQIGGLRPGFPLQDFGGKIDEVRVYNRVLSNTEVSSVYNQTIPPTVLEAETMTVSNPDIDVIADVNASGGQALKFRKDGNATKDVNTTPAIQLIVRARGDQCSGSPRMRVKIDGVEVLMAHVEATVWTDYAINISLASGTHTIKVIYDNDFNNQNCNRNLFVDRVTLSPVNFF